jgi:GNAT superfamily N-acetyltransferase
MEDVQVVDTNADNILEYGVCGSRNIKNAGFAAKVAWLKARWPEGMKIKTLFSDTDGMQGMIEYLPGEYCWRPVDAGGYMFVHCIFVGIQKAYKGKGYGSLLLQACLEEAKKRKMHGVAAVTRRGPFMAGKDIFAKHGFTVVDTAPPDFELVVTRFHKNAPVPKFKGDQAKRLSLYRQGLTIVRADQCPYSVKNVAEMVGTARTVFGLQPRIVTLGSCEEAQNSPCPFGTFCIVHDGKVIACHPISNTRFTNIMKGILR